MFLSCFFYIGSIFFTEYIFVILQHFFSLQVPISPAFFEFKKIYHGFLCNQLISMRRIFPSKMSDTTENDFPFPNSKHFLTIRHDLN